MKKSGILITLGVVLMMASLALLFHNNHRISEQKQEAIDLEKEFEMADPADAGVEQAQGAAEIEEQKAVVNATANQVDLGNASAEYEGELPGEVDSFGVQGDAIDKRAAIGVIRINEIGVVMPIYDNTRPKSLIYGAGLLETTDLPSSEKNTITVLAGHRGGRNERLTFINIGELHEGSEIRITTRS